MTQRTTPDTLRDDPPASEPVLDYGRSGRPAAGGWINCAISMAVAALASSVVWGFIALVVVMFVDDRGRGFPAHRFLASVLLAIDLVLAVCVGVATFRWVR